MGGGERNIQDDGAKKKREKSCVDVTEEFFYF